MRTILAILLCLSIHGVSQPYAINPDNNYVVIVSGQSNAAGYPPTDSCYYPYRKNANVKIWNGSTFAVMDAGINNNQYPSAGGLFAYEMSLGYSIQYYTKGTVYVIKYAIGGTAMDNFWKVSLGTGYTNLYNTINNGLAALSGESYEVVGMFWYQGESDCTASFAPLYSASLNTFLAQLRTDLGISLYYYLIRIHKDCPYVNAYEAQIRAADSLFVDTDGGNSEWVSVDDLPRYTGSAHITAGAQTTLGIRLADLCTPNLRIKKYHPIQY